jgi:putative DNA primase/helicase
LFATIRNDRRFEKQATITLTASWTAQALGGSASPNSSNWYRAPCPAHAGDAADTLALHDGDYGLIVYCHKGCARRAVFAAISALLRDGRFNRPAPSASTAAVARVATPEDLLRSAQRRWAETTAIAGTLGEQYLRIARGITIALPVTLRFHPHLLHPSGVRGPAIVAAVVDVDDEQCAIHRIWLDPETGGLARFDKSKLSLGATTGCGVRLGEATNAVAVTEGVETGLSLQQLTGRPAWAALGSGLRSIVLPPGIRDVLIGADNDAAGIAAANELRARLLGEGRSVRVITPRTPGWDFNDQIRGKAV